MTREEQIEHWVEHKGICHLPGSFCNSGRCAYKESRYGPCLSPKIYSWAMSQKQREGMCESIWD